MEKTTLSTKGQVIIPKSIRDLNHFEEGQEFYVVDTKEGVLLKPKRNYPFVPLEEVAGCLAYSGKPKTIEQMNDAIAKGVKNEFG